MTVSRHLKYRAYFVTKIRSIYIFYIHYRTSYSFMYATLPVQQRLTQLQAK